MPKREEFNGFDDDIFSPEEFDEEETPTEEPNEEESSEDDNEEQVDAQEETSDTAETTDEQVKTQNDDEAEEKAKAEAEKNSYYAKKRREREALEKAQREKEIREAAKLEAELGMIKKNPYTNEAISDEEDLKIYKLQKAIEEKGGDPLSDLPKALAEQNRREAQERKALAEKNQADQNKLAEEAKELYANHPEAGNVDDTFTQEMIELHQKKDGRWTLSECYEHLAQQRKYEESVKKKTQTEQKKKEVVEETTKKYHKIPGAQANGGKVSDDVLALSDEEYLRKERERKKDDFF